MKEKDEDNSLYITKKTEDSKIFQIGWQIGLGFEISKVYIGMQYGIDFIPRDKMNKSSDSTTNGHQSISDYSYDLNSSHILVSIGFNF